MANLTYTVTVETLEASHGGGTGNAYLDGSQRILLVQEQFQVG